MSTTIHVGNALDVLAGLPSESVHCCVTSPPYWGLRSYHLQRWDGGDPDCEHQLDTQHQKQGATSIRKGRSNVEAQRNETTDCGCACGAQRVVVDGGIGLEPTFDGHLENLVAVFREVRRVLRDDGTLWLNYGDAYTSGGRTSYVPDSSINTAARANGQRSPMPAGLKPKDLMMMPARVAMALQADGWWLRSEIIWHKPNPMPESVTDRPTNAHEKMFLLTKSARYFYDAEAVRVAHAREWDAATNDKSVHEKTAKYQAIGHCDGPTSFRKDSRDYSGANLRNVWTIATHSFKDAHFATFPPALVEPCIKAGTSERGVCGECGAPWKRQVETKNGRGRSWHDHVDDQSRGQRGDSCPDGYERTTTGWVPTCEHKADTVPAVVLDCFAGSGTIGLVADRLQRDSVLIELSPEYAEMAGRRIKADAPLFANVVAGGDTL